jgi:hypothetical protein
MDRLDANAAGADHRRYRFILQNYLSGGVIPESGAVACKHYPSGSVLPKGAPPPKILGGMRAANTGRKRR